MSRPILGGSADQSTVIRSPNFVDISGCRFGRLTAIRPVASTPYGKIKWLCKCDCGGNRVVIGSHLRSGGTKSCGCLVTDTSKANAVKRRVHGASHTTEHRIWSGMINRCTNANDPIFSRYGARGITVCERWSRSFVSFLADMGKRPSVNHTIDRIDNNAGYSPDNCRWATRKEQARNRRGNRLITYRNETMVLSEWAERIGMEVGTLWRRLERGWPVDKALATPVMQIGNKGM